MIKTVDIHLIARVCHEVNRVFCESIGDTSQVPWDSAPELIKGSAIQGVVSQLNSPKTPEETHQAWLEHKIATGWKYGMIKDIDKKTHPSMVPYHLLSKNEQTKDHLFAAVVKCFVE